VDEAAQLVRQYAMPLMKARVLIAQDDPSAALAVLEPERQQAEAKRLPQRLLLVLAVQSVVLFAQGEKDQAVQVLAEALALAEPDGYIRVFVDEGALMAQLLLEAASRGIRPDYIARLLAAFEADKRDREGKPALPPAGSLIEPLSQRELEILKLIAQGLSNREIGERLFLALDTIKGHNRKIFDKLQAQSRTEAIARARALGLL
jgi:LuxR family maltose regulon positive regulatory protein